MCDPAVLDLCSIMCETQFGLLQNHTLEAVQTATCSQAATAELHKRDQELASDRRVLAERRHAAEHEIRAAQHERDAVVTGLRVSTAAAMCITAIFLKSKKQSFFKLKW